MVYVAVSLTEGVLLEGSLSFVSLEPSLVFPTRSANVEIRVVS